MKNWGEGNDPIFIFVAIGMSSFRIIRNFSWSDFANIEFIFKFPMATLLGFSYLNF